MKPIGVVILLFVVVGGILFLRRTSSPVVTKDVVSLDRESISASPTMATTSGSIAPVEQIPITQMKQYKTAPAKTIDDSKSYTATVETTKGAMRFVLYSKEAPTAVNNFVFLSREGYYSQTPFHRIIRGFMIQGGDPTGTGRGGPGYQFADEPVTREYTRGVLAMANAGPNTNGSQFFVMHEDTDLPKNYVIFGSIEPTDKESLATLDGIATVGVVQSESGEKSKPTEPILIKSISITEK